MDTSACASVLEMNEEGFIHQPHDKLFKSTFSQPENARPFLCHHLPDQLVASLNWATLALQPGSFIDSQFRLSESDLLFAVAKNSGRSLIHILFEHQKVNDHDLMFRLLRYKSRIWETFSGPSGSKRPTVVSVVVAQNAIHWEAPQQFADLIDVVEGGEKFVPDFSYVLIQLADLPFHHIAGTPDGILVMRTLKAEAGNELLANELWDTELFRQTSARTFEMVLGYLLSREIDKAAFRIKITEIQDASIRDKAMTLAEQLKDEGLQQGLEQGLEKGLERGLEQGLEQGLARGREEGFEKGVLIGQIRSLQEILHEPLTPEVALFQMHCDALRELVKELKARF
ncbi:MAG: Rpn family recombination-promoting nuclease/putative transposase [Verrucomicrobiales bacterium]